MKKCPACNRTYADETLSFCLEDGSLLSASFNLYEEQKTVVRPDVSATVPTVVSAKNTNSKIAPRAKQLGRLFLLGLNVVSALGLIVISVLAAINNKSATPMILPLVAALIYLGYIVYKKLK